MIRKSKDSLLETDQGDWLVLCVCVFVCARACVSCYGKACEDLAETGLLKCCRQTGSRSGTAAVVEFRNVKNQFKSLNFWDGEQGGSWLKPRH